jgi:hypothetical protein
MTQTLEVEIDEAGQIRPVDASLHLPKGRATFVLNRIDNECYILSEAALADSLSPEEDEAWAYLQPTK